MDTKKLRQKILDLAIRGKLVPQDPNDEPASVLLERIRAEKERLIAEGKIKRSKKSATSDTPHYENVPFEVPKGWMWAMGLDIFKPMKTAFPTGETFNYIDIDAIDNKRNIITAVKVINTNQAPSRASRYTEKGCVLFSMVRPYLRNIAIVLENNCIASTGFFVCHTKNCLLPKFCYYQMLSNYVVDGLNNFIKGDNSPSITKGQIETFLFPIPPREEQKRIVSVIEQWFTLINILEDAKGDLQNLISQAKSKILDLAIHGKLVPQDPTDEPAIELLKRINPKFTPCDNEHYPQLPENWVLCKLEDIVDYVQPTLYIVSSTEYKDTFATPVLTAGKSFIIGRTNETNGIYSNLPCIIFDDFTTDSKYVDFPFKVKSSAMKILKVKDEILPKYVAMFMSITRLVGKTHKRYWISEYSKIQIPIPPKQEQQRIISAVENLNKVLDNITESL